MWNLSEEQTIARDSFAALLRKEIAPDIRQAASGEQFPPDVLRACLQRLAPYGLGNFRVPCESGGLGLDHLTAGLMHETAAQIVPELSQPAIINEAVALLLAELGSQSLRDEYLRPLVAGRLIAASANTELTGGSDVSSITTRAQPTDDGFMITGRKAWITNAHCADIVLVLARTQGTERPDLYLLDRAKQRFDVRPVKLAGRITAAELGFDHTEVPAQNRLTADSAGLDIALASFRSMRSFVALSAVGIAQAAQDHALAFAATRSQFGAPLAAKQLIQQQLADSAVEIEAARLLAYSALSDADRGQDGISGSMAKLYASEMVQRVTYRAVQIHGAAGVCETMPVERLAQAARIFPIVEGTSEIQRLIIGRSLTGVRAF